MRRFAPPLLASLLACPLLAQTTFTTFNPPSCPAPDSVAAGDLDGDGDVDLLTTHPASAQACANLNGGTGTTWVNGSLFSYAPGTLPTEAVVAQLDGGGRADVAVVLNGTAQVAIHLATGAWPAFAPPQLVAVHPGAVEATSFDVDGDGDLDLAVICDTSMVVRVLVNTGGVFAAAPPLALGGVLPTAIEAGDLNGDGLADLALTGVQTGGLAVALINTTPTPSSPPAFATPQTYPIDQRPYGICIGDLNGDGYNDLATANAGFSTVDVLLNDPSVLPGTTVAFNGTNYPLAPGVIAGPFTEVDCADLDCDGDADLGVTCNGSHRIAFFWNNGSGGFGAPAFFASPLGCADLTFADLSGDGWPDAASSNGPSNTIGVLLNGLAARCCVHRLVGGIPDGFGLALPAGPEDACPAPDLLTWFGAPVRRDFDGPVQCGRALLHTFRGLPGAIKSARLTMRMRADCPTSPNDRFMLGFDSVNGGMVWMRPMTAVTGSPWTAGTFGGVSLDLGALSGGTSLLAKMSAEGRLDVLLGDGTAVDAMSLSIETCASSNVTSAHSASPYVWGTTVSWTVSGAPPSGGTAFLIGTGIGPGLTFPGGDLCITGASLLAIQPTTPSGTSTFSIPLPPIPFPPCITVATQVLSWDSTVTTFAHSNTLVQQFFD